MATHYVKQLCVDVKLQGTDYEKSHAEILSRSSSRKPEFGSTYLWTEERWTGIKGGESSILLAAAKALFEGDVLAVDGLTSEGINISANVSQLQYEKAKTNPRFKIQAEIDIDLMR